MGKSLLFSSLIFLFPFIISIDSTSTSCPINFSYVETFPWDTSMCHRVDANQKNCCQTLRSLIGIGFAQYLKETSMFYLPNAVSSSSCLSNFQTKLDAMPVQPSLVPRCFNATEFVNVANNSLCGGIITTQDWTQKVGAATPLDLYCKGDLMRLVWCSLCLDAGLKATSQLVALGPNSTKCFYFNMLYAAAIVNEYGPKDSRTATCILKLPLSDSAITNSSKKLSRESLFTLVSGLLGAPMGVLLALGIIILYRFSDKKKKKKKQQQKRSRTREEFVSSVKVRVLPNMGAKWFHVAELEQATNGFSQTNLIGRGGYGVVYKGILSDGTTVAVKQILDLDAKGDEEFSNEVEIISKIRHRNLLSLRGCCVASENSKGQQRYLVYDFMSNNSLHDHLFDSGANKDSRQKLTWPQRKNIILDITKGLNYLHNGIRPAIYHRDIKPTKILLDTEMKARVADFRLAKQSREGQSHLTTRVAGTLGYLAPEYALYGQLTEKSDVYSFGIVILEILSGRKVLDTSNSSSMILITDWAWMLVKSGNVKEAFDESIREEGPRGIMERFVLVGILCAHVTVAIRPTIAEALKMLEGDIDIPRLPDRPLPLSHESFRSSLRYSTLTSERSRASSSNISI